MKRVFTCPYCYGTHTLDEIVMKCSYKTVDPKDNQRPFVCHNDSKIGDAACPKDNSGYIRTVKQKRKCQRCTDAAKTYHCPQSPTLEIPGEFAEQKSLPIALVGAKNTGKSNYVAVLIEEISRKMSGAFNCTINKTCSERSYYDYKTHYYDPVYEQSTVAGTTDKVEIPPLIFPLKFNSSGKTVTLTFYDTAGENFDNASDMVIYNKYLPNAKGIIFLIDPLQIDSVREKLKDKMTLPPKNTDAAIVLNRVIYNIRNVKNIKGKIKIPIAVVLTKTDVLEKYDILPTDCCLRLESQHIEKGAFVLTDFMNTNREIKEMIQSYLGSELSVLLENMGDYALFGISALGSSPDEQNKLHDKVSPRRVLDPLLWLLHKNKYIESKQ